MTTSSLKAAALTMALALSPVDAFWRMPCPGRLVLERIDPIVNPGAVAGHVHTVSGGNGFGFTTDFDTMRNSSCTSCPIKADMSAYWTPKLYWRNQDNTEFIDVPQAGEYNGNTGGHTVYYQQRYSKSAPNKVQAFPKDFRMLAGNPSARSFNDVPAAPGQAVSFVCLNYAGKSPQTNAIPNNNCPDGLRAQVYFPSCWDGVNADSPDHKSHVAYPINGSYDSGQCPSTHPVRLISIFYEVIYSINDFKDDWWSDSQHPFVFSMGDTTGYGFHGDFLNGWDIDVLQQAADTCTNDSGRIEDCPVFNNGLFANSDSESCQIPQLINEAVVGNLSALPGCNPVSSGPDNATPGNCTGAVAAVIGAAKQPYTDMTSEGWAYQGCAIDNFYTRTFTGAFSSGKDMTVASCTAFCKSKGYSLAGLEYSTQCFCDNKYQVASAAPKANVLGGCTMPCAGDSTELCGGGGALSVYSACSDGDSCVNTQYQSIGGAVGSLVGNVLGGLTSGGQSSSSSAPAAATSSADATSQNGQALRRRLQSFRRRRQHKHS